jgi:hypothetical protein
VGVYHFMLDGVRVWLIDTPGFDDTNRSDSDVLKDIAYWLASAYTRKVHLAGIIYLHRITDVRMQGSALRNLRMFNELCGLNNLKSVILATTHWTHGEGKSVPESVGEARVKELEETKEFWGGMIERGSRVEKHDGSKASAIRTVSDLVNRHDPVTLGIQRQLVDEKRSLFDTDAGQALRRELIEDRKRAEAKLAELKLDMESALQEKDKKWQEQIKQDRANLEAKIQQGSQETEALKINIKKIAREKDVELREMQRRWEIERADWEAKLRKAMKEIEISKATKETEASKATEETEASKAAEETEASKATEGTKISMKKIEASKTLNWQRTATVYEYTDDLDDLDDIDPWDKRHKGYAKELERMERRQRRISYEVPWRL